MHLKISTASSIIAFVYIVCFQLFISSGYYFFLYIGNVLFFIGVALFTFAKRSGVQSQFLPLLTGMGIRFSFFTAIFSLGGCLLLCLLHYYILPYLKTIPDFIFKPGQWNNQFLNLKWLTGLSVLNAFIANLVSGSVASLLTAGIANERNYQQNSSVLPSVKN